MSDPTLIIVNHAFCELAVEIYEWASVNGHTDLCDRLDRWVRRYVEVLDLEIDLHR